MAGFTNDVVYANNGDFSTAGSVKGQASNGLLTNGQMWIGTTSTNAGGTHINVGTLTSPLGTLSIGYSSPNITLDLVGGSVAIETITGNTGGAESPSAGNFNFLTANSTVKFAGTAATETVDFGLTNLLLGSSGSSISSGTLNAGVGLNALLVLSSGDANSAIGYRSLFSLSSGSFNTSIGQASLNALVSGSHNTVIGTSAGGGYTSSESSNIVIKNLGTTGESNVIKIGSQGNSLGQQNKCFIAGITGVSTSNSTLSA